MMIFCLPVAAATRCLSRRVHGLLFACTHESRPSTNNHQKYSATNDPSERIPQDVEFDLKAGSVIRYLITDGTVNDRVCYGGHQHIHHGDGDHEDFPRAEGANEVDDGGGWYHDAFLQPRELVQKADARAQCRSHQRAQHAEQRKGGHQQNVPAAGGTGRLHQGMQGIRQPQIQSEDVMQQLRTGALDDALHALQLQCPVYGVDGGACRDHVRE
mmetsp:Transcript_17374/g.48994  ORF Transcript_17374/g.48994 Transcript_17374/m.48994 type:complete len:214 (+) Transcript_17374:145-786(+)